MYYDTSLLKPKFIHVFAYVTTTKKPNKQTQNQKSKNTNTLSLTCLSLQNFSLKN